MDCGKKDSIVTQADPTQEIVMSSPQLAGKREKSGKEKDATPELAKKPETRTEITSDFSSFKPTAGWSCSTCMASNPVDKNSCLACETPKPGTKPVQKSLPAPTFGSGGGFKFGGDSVAKADGGSIGGLFSFGSGGKAGGGESVMSSEQLASMREKSGSQQVDSQEG